MFRVVVYRTNNEGRKLCYCFSRRFDFYDDAKQFAERCKARPRRAVEIH